VDPRPASPAILSARTKGGEKKLHKKIYCAISRRKGGSCAIHRARGNSEGTGNLRGGELWEPCPNHMPRILEKLLQRAEPGS